jgi:acyl transferase domain-containing protein
MSGDGRLERLSPERRLLLEKLLADREAAAAPPAKDTDDRAIAIVGIGCRFPGAGRGPEAFWRLLVEGREAVTEAPAERLGAPGLPIASRRAGLLDAIETFDAAFFGISPREARTMDPQQRLLLETAWEALEDAGAPPDGLDGAPVGVFAGLSEPDYADRHFRSGDESRIEAHSGTGSMTSIAVGRVSFHFGFRGPSLAVDTACSSSLVAVHLACASLRAGECDLALAGGVNAILSADRSIALSLLRALSPEGRCRTFDARADGFVRGEGCGLVVLKRLAAARAARDRIVAVIRGSAVNQDGRTNGLTAPSGAAQEAVIRRALADAEIAPDRVGYVEAHGTGTPLGDPIEVHAIHEALRRGRAPERPVLVGSVKTNVGHLETAAGIAGLIKAALAVHHGTIPPSLHFETPNPRIDWRSIAVRVAASPTVWRPDGPRVAGVSSFGFGGTNAHVVLEEAPPGPPAPPRAAPDRLAHLLPLSARDEGALRELAARIADAITGADLSDAAHAAAVGRGHLAERAAIVAATPDEAVGALRALARGEAPAAVARGRAERRPPRVAFLFTGQGSQHAGMARALYEREPRFRAALERCARVLDPLLGRPLLDVLYPPEGMRSPIDETRFTQPALFAIEWALAELWRAVGIRPEAVLGHSVGEIAAACVAGVFDVEDALRLVAARGRLMGELPSGGAMVSVRADERRVAAVLAPFRESAAIAAINAPEEVVISGAEDAIGAVAAALGREGIRVARLAVSHAFHSPLIRPSVGPFEEAAARLRYERPKLVLISNVTGAAAGAEVAQPAYWARHIEAPVRFQDGIRTCAALGIDAFLEIGPRPTLLALGRASLGGEDTGRAVWLPSVRPGHDDFRTLFSSLAALYVRGAPIDWRALDAPWPRRFVSLPTYPFRADRHWIDRATGPAGAGELRVSVRAPPPLFEIAWRDCPREAPPVRPSPGRWLIVAGPGDAGERLATALEARGALAVLAEPGAALERVATSRWRFDPGSPAEVERLVSEVRAEGAPLRGIVHLPALDASPDALDLAALGRARATVLGSALALVRGALAGAEGERPRLSFVTRGAVAVGSPAPRVGAAQAPLRGLARSLSLEHPELGVMLVDVDAVSDALALELLGPDGEDDIALRGRARLVARLAPRPVAASRAPFHTTGAWLVTGGTGALGLRIAGWLASRGARRLVLASRRGLDSSGAREATSELERAGATVEVVAADLASERDADRALAALAAGDEPPRGIVHAAGVAAQIPARATRPEDFARMLGPKVDGAWLLHDRSRGLPLERFILISSVAAVWGGAGQAAYAAANAFLEALAADRRAAGLPATCVSFGPWAGGGMAAGEAGARLERAGLRRMAPEAALAALDEVLAEPCGSAVAADVDWTSFRAAYEARRPRRLLSEIGEPPVLAAAAVAREPAWLALLRAAAPGDARRAVARDLLRAEVARTLGHADPAAIDPRRGFFELGLDSLMAVEIARTIEARTGLRVATTAAFREPTIEALASWVLGELGFAPEKPSATAPAAPAPRAPSTEREPIAIVGLACRFPGGAADPESFWRLLDEGREAVGEVPADRWDASALYDRDPDVPGRSYAARASFLAGIDRFDPAFFGISQREAEQMDPQHRLLLEVAWEALESAAIPAPDLARRRAGVFVGIAPGEYGLEARGGGLADLEAHGATGTATSFAAGRISYVLGLEGPSVAVDTACSSALVAIHLACRSLRAGECEVAVAGGVSLMISPATTVYLSRLHALSSDGRCRAFSAEANGYGRGEGCGVVILKPLARARAEGDRILAVIRGMGVSHGGRGAGLTVPSARGEEAAIRLALEDAGVAPRDVAYLEAHGTGTALGDPIEVEAAAAVYGEGRPAGAPLLIGTVKTNIGHLEAAAGIAGLAKVVLALAHERLPAHLHCAEPSPKIDWARVLVEVTRAARPWPRGARPRLAGISSFGMSGTNAHAIIEEPPPGAPAAPAPREPIRERPLHILPLSARDDDALDALAERYEAYLRAGECPPLADICFTAATGRAHFHCRFAIVAGSKEELRAALASLRAGRAPRPPRAPAHGPRVTFRFPEHGAEPERAEADIVLEVDPDRADWPSLLGEVAALYVAGAEVDWRGLDRPYPRRKVDLPTYPFRRRRCWVSAAAAAPGGRLASAEGEPLHGRPVAVPSDECHFAASLSLERHPFLDDHRIYGEPIVPGAFHLAAVLSAAPALTRGGAARGGAVLADIVFPAALRLRPGQTCALHTAFSPEGPAAWRFRVATPAWGEGAAAPGEPTWREHAGGRLVAFDPDGDRVAPLAAGDPLAGSGSTVSGPEIYRMLADLGYDLGPRFQWIEEIRRGDNEIIARLAAPADAGDPGGPIHPALLDSCFQSLVGLIDPARLDGAYVPLEIRSLRFRGGPPAGPFVCRVRISGDDGRAGGAGETWTADLRLFDGAGEPVLLVEGFCVKRAPRAALLAGARAETRPSPEGFYRAIWAPAQGEAPRHDLAAAGPGAWCVLAGSQNPVADALCAALAARGERVVRTESVPGAPALPACRGVVHLSSVDREDGGRGVRSPGFELDEVSERCGRVADLVRALVESPGRDAPCLWLVTRGAQAAGNAAAAVAAAQAPLWGLGRVVAREHPELRCARVDLDPAERTPAADAAALVRELLDGAEEEVALRGGQRLAGRLARVLPPVAGEAPRPLARPDGTALVTGGLGALGSVLARELVARGARHVVLAGRTAPSATVRMDIEALERRGARVRVASCDVSRREEVAALLDEIDRTMPPLRSVFHLAGIVDDAPAIGLDRARFRRVLAPKAAGAWHLHELTRARELDAFCLASSAAALFGAPGQGSYAAANAFLDALAALRRAEGLPGTSVAFGPFAEVGMAAARPSTLPRLRSLGVEPLPPEAIVDAFERLVRDGAAATCAIRLDTRQWLEASPQLGDQPFFSLLVAEAQAARPRAARGELAASLGAAEPRRRAAIIESHIRELLARTLRTQARDVTRDAPIADFGLDSLMALEIRNRLERDLAVELPASLLWSHPTVSALADHLARLAAGADAAPAGAPTDAAVTPHAHAHAPGAPEDLDALSEDELIARLAAKLGS